MRIRQFVLVVGYGLVLGCGATTRSLHGGASESLDARIARGRVLWQQGLYDAAEAEWQAVLALDPRAAEAMTWLGYAAQVRGDVPGAVAMHRDALALNPQLGLAHYHLGLAHMAAEQWDAAVASLREAVRLEPAQVEWHFRLGTALESGCGLSPTLTTGHWDEAIVAYEQALELAPHDPELRDQVRAAVVRARGVKAGIDGRIARWKRELARQPEHPHAHYMLARAYREKCWTAAALEQYRLCLRDDSAHVPAHFELGQLLESQGRRDAALLEYRWVEAHCGRVLAQDPARPEAHYYLGAALAAQGLQEEAATAFREAASLKADYAVAYVALGDALQYLGQLDAAVDAYERAVAAEPHGEYLHVRWGDLLRFKGDIPGAIGCYEAALATNPQSARAAQRLLAAQRLQFHEGPARAAYRSALRLNPESAEPRGGAEGRPQGAEPVLTESMRAYQEALRIQPRYPDAHFGLGQALHRQGFIDAARAEYELALEQYAEALKLHPSRAAASPYVPPRDAFHYAYAAALTHLHLAMALRAQGQSGAALAHYELAGEQFADLAHAAERTHRTGPEYTQVLAARTDALVQQGHALRLAGRHHAAEAAYRAALALRAHEPEAHYGLATIYHDRELWKDAVAEYHAALRDSHDRATALREGLGLRDGVILDVPSPDLQVVPLEVAARTGLGLALLRTGNMRGATTQLEAAHALAPADPALLTHLGKAYLDSHALDRAVQAFRKALKLQPQNAEAHAYLAAALERQRGAGGLQAAAASPEQARQSREGAALERARVLFAQGQRAAARAALEELLVADPRNCAAAGLLARVLEDMGAFGDAREMKTRANLCDRERLHLALRDNPEDAYARARLGEAYLQAGYTEAALEQLREAVRLAPQLPTAHAALGDWHYNAGRVAAAVAEYRAALGGAPNGGDIHAKLARALYYSGDCAGARAHAREAERQGVDTSGYLSLAVIDRDPWKRCR